MNNTNMGRVNRTSNYPLARQVAVIDPYPRSFVKSNQITFTSRHGQLQVAQNDIALALDAETAIGQTGVGPNTQNADVAADVHDSTAIQYAANTDDAAGRDGALQSRA